jgi:hypothetical protein
MMFCDRNKKMANVKGIEEVFDAHEALEKINPLN